MTDNETGDRRRGGGSAGGGSSGGDGGGAKTLSLRSGGPGRVRQSFSHGRSKSVVVEKVNAKRRTITKPTEKPEGRSAAPKELDPIKRAAKKAGLSEEETQRRLRALEAAKIAEAERKKREAAEAKKRAEVAAKRKAEEEEQKRRDAEEAARRLAEEKAAEEERLRREAEEAAMAAAAKAAGAQAAPAPAAAPTPAARPATEERRPLAAKPRAPEPPKKPTTTRGKGDDRRRSSKLTITRALSGDAEGGRQRSEAAMKRRIQRQQRQQRGGGQQNQQKVYRDVVVPEAITVQELAQRMTERVGDVIKALMNMGVMARQNDSIDQDTAELVVTEFGHRVSRVSEADVETAINIAEDEEGDLKSRAPVVTIMGHVDHGKTSLLDKLRSANVVAGEAGGITQHIGAYQVAAASGAKITFLDTPGHAAFTSMRARGAQVTDIVILVVAADDSVMPQTVEAISHAKAAEVPMIIAINKIDKPAADAQKVRVELLQHDIQVEAMGGEILDVEVSAMTGQGLDELIEQISLQAELLELKANPGRNAQGAVIEAKLDVGRGPVATVLVQRGTLRVGDIFVVGEQWGKVRALINDKGDRVKEAGPSAPVEVLGLNGAPEAGDVLDVVESEAEAREISEYRGRKSKEKQAAIGARTTLDQLLAQAKSDANTAELPIVVKGDVQGSVEAIVQAVEKIGNDEVRVRILHSGVGAITESDVTLADASRAPIIGFNVRANAPARDAAQQKGVEIRYYSIIYDLVDDVKAAASGLLSPEVREKFIGYASIKQVFKITGVGNVAGCEVTEGVARREAGVRLLRDKVVIHTGKLKTLKRFKDEVKEVPAGQECGMAFEKYEDIREGDEIEIFETEEIQRTLE